MSKLQLYCLDAIAQKMNIDTSLKDALTSQIEATAVRNESIEALAGTVAFQNCVEAGILKQEFKRIESIENGEATALEPSTVLSMGRSCRQTKMGP